MREICIYGLIVVSAVHFLCGCGMHPQVTHSSSSPPGIYTPISATNVKDGRHDFRAMFCAVSGARRGVYPDDMPCSDALHRMDDESIANRSSVALRPPRPVTVVVVTGIFGECIAEYLLPFSDGKYFKGYSPQRHGYEYIQVLGYKDIRVIITPGRSSTSANGRFIKGILEKTAAETNKDIIIVAYSKGVTDVLHGLTLFREVPRNIRALVSVAGVVGGTPVADWAADAYDRLLKNIPIKACQPGDGDGVRSLTRENQFAWLSSHKLPQSVKYYSLAAFPSKGHTNVILKPFHSALSGIDNRNDGQVLIQDAIIPVGTLLGYLNGDHWAVTMAFNRSKHPEWRRVVDQNAFPREVLFESILRYVEQDTARAPNPSGN